MPQVNLADRRPEALQYLGASFGVTAPLLGFWQRAGYLPVYLRQTPSDVSTATQIDVRNPRSRVQCVRKGCFLLKLDSLHATLGSVHMSHVGTVQTCGMNRHSYIANQTHSFKIQPS